MSAVAARTRDDGNRVSAGAAQESSKLLRRRAQWAALRLLWSISTLRNVRKCRKVTRGNAGAIARRGDRAHYTGLKTCGSVWVCPCCSAKIQAKRTDELVQAVEHAYACGMRVAFATLTMRHKRRHKLKPMWDALSDAWAAAMGRDRAVRRAKAALGVVGWVRRVEATHGWVNGWHLHAHALIFYSGGEEQRTHNPLRGLAELREAMWSAWLRRLGAHGLDADRRHGLVLRELDLEQALEEAAAYLNKSTYEQTSGSAARELAGQLGKVGKGGNRSPFDVLADLATNGEARDLALWREWEKASFGRRALTWSKGLREQLLPDVDELTDEQLADENDGGQEEVAVFGADVWRNIVRRRLEVALLEAVEAVPIEDSYGAAAAFVAEHELGPLWRPRRE